MKSVEKPDTGLMLFGDVVSFSMDADELNLFLSSVTSFLKESAKRLKGQYDRYGLSRADSFEESLPEILFTSVIIATVSLLEREMGIIAKELQKAIDLPLSISDLNGSWIEKFPKYCKVAAGIEIRENQRLWQDASDCVAIRNCLVHANGDLSEGTAQTKRALSFFSRHRLKCVSDDRVIPNEQLASDILSSVRQFVEAAYQQGLEKYPRK